MSWVAKVIDWFWVVGVAGALSGAAMVWGSLPGRVEKVEVSDGKQEEAIVDLKGIAQRLDGYTEAMNRMQQRPPESVVEPPTFIEYDEEGVAWCCQAWEVKECEIIDWWRCE